MSELTNQIRARLKLENLPADSVSCQAYNRGIEDALAEVEARAREDAEPITREWLQDAGFSLQGHIDEGISILADISVQEHTGWYQFLRIRLPMLEAQLMQCQAGGNEAEGMALPENCCKTRGDVRRLCAALNIPLAKGDGA
jgi:hypothetical protein